MLSVHSLRCVTNVFTAEKFDVTIFYVVFTNFRISKNNVIGSLYRFEYLTIESVFK